MFAAPVVGVVLDAAGFVDGDLVALNDPFDGRLAVDDVIVGFQRDAIEGEVGVVVDAGLVRLEAGVFLGGRGLSEGHFGDVELLPWVEAEFRGDFGERIWFDGFVVEMPLGEGAASLGEFPVVRRLLSQRNAREHLLEIRGEAAAVFRGMQDAIDVVEDVILAHVLAVDFAELYQYVVDDKKVRQVLVVQRDA